MSEISIINPQEDSRWDNFVFKHPYSSIYHTAAWQKVINDAYRLEPLYVALEEKERGIVGGIPLFGVDSKLSQKKLSALPCAQYCNPLVRNQQEFEEILRYVIKLLQIHSYKYIELKTDANFKLETEPFGNGYFNFFTYQLGLERPIDDIIKTFHKSCVQRVIKKSYKNDLQLERAGSEKDVKSFYRLYLSMRKRYGLLPQPLIFFLMMWRNLSKHNYIDIFLCKKNGIIAGSILLLYFRDTVIYEYGASKPSMLEYGVSHFLLWEAIKHAHARGFKKFDFGRTFGENGGLNEFKSRWGTEKMPLPYYFIPKTENFSLMRQKKTLNRLMNITISSFPAFAGQMMGRALYRHLL
jgi:hypothetical protein